MFQNVIRSMDMMYLKAGSFESLENFPGFEGGQLLAHAASNVILICSLIGSPGIRLSAGIETPSFCRLSK